MTIEDNKKYKLTGEQIKDLASRLSILGAEADGKAEKALSGNDAPTDSTPGEIGQLYIQSDGTVYILKSIVEESGQPDEYTWEEVGAGGPTVVQTTGTSTTDVMSQKAVTDAIAGSGGPTVVQTTGTSTTDVMSQNATTSMVFADPANRTQVRIGNNNSVSGAVNLGCTIAGNNNTLKSVYGGVLLGDHSKVGTDINSSYAVAIGSHTNATGNQSVALGYYPTASGVNSIAIGGSDSTLTVASAYNSIALGGARATVQGQFDVSTGTNATGGYNSSNYRLLTGLYDGQNDHDAVTVGQLNTAIAGAGAAEINSTDWSALWQ